MLDSPVVIAQSDSESAISAELRPLPSVAFSADPDEVLDRAPDVEKKSRGLRPDAIRGYEILSEVGRGGMGVVYKALDLRLKRPVAVKVILSGGHAGTVERQRFQIEAESSAHLQHPNIIQVYEIGEADERPFLAMEYCPGGSLQDRIQDHAQPPLEAARLITTLSRALHYAHQSGIVHRDMKPGNIVFAADGTPKITDFGLAKRLDKEEQYTQTGVILGSVGYMAPEQASGRTREATPITDVYSLGALLYKMLTGVPPFQGVTDWETVEQIVKNEAVSITSLQPKVPRDLATICHKCLEKDPARRYPTALALAEDLERFLADQPIQARPLGFSERTVRWARRYPALMSVVLCNLLMILLVTGVLGWSSYRSYKLMNDIYHTERPLQDIGGQIRYLDEALTSSAYLSATTGDVAWQSRYRIHETELDAALKQARLMAPEAAPALQEVESANSALITMEHDAFQKVEAGQASDAWKELQSEQYQTLKKQYANGLTQFIQQLYNRERTFLDKARQESAAILATATVFAIGIILLFSVGSVLVVRTLSKEK